MKAISKSQVVSHLAAKAGMRKRAAPTVSGKLATLATKEHKGPRVFVVGKAAKVYRNPHTGRAPRTGKAVEIAAKPTVKFRRASANSDEVFATLAKAFSPL
ncbi:MAG TPA: HU family DNA-binding protein [Terriglobia bacterium]|nr:HU family DNA-binding protein [Terriglobia bacterium]